LRNCSSCKKKFLSLSTRSTISYTGSMLVTSWST